MSATASEVRPRHSLVPQEAMRSARLLRNAVLEADIECDMALMMLIRPLTLRLRRKPTLRQLQVLRLCQRWSSLPRAFHISANVTPDDDKVGATECRLKATGWSDDQWPGGGTEPGLAVCRIDLQAGYEPFRLTVKTRPLVVFSLHAIARCFERLRINNATVVFHHMASSISPTAKWEEDAITVLAGRWLGPVQEALVNGNVIRVRAVRSFLPTGW
jgi:hypothetical protein